MNWTAYRITFQVKDRQRKWVRFAPNLEHARNSAAQALAHEYADKATLISVKPCPDPSRDYDIGVTCPACGRQWETTYGNAYLNARNCQYQAYCGCEEWYEYQEVTR